WVDPDIDLQVNIREFDTATLAKQLGLGLDKNKLENMGASPMPYDDPEQVRRETPRHLQEAFPKIDGEYQIVADWPIQIEANVLGGDVSENVVGVDDGPAKLGPQQ